MSRLDKHGDGCSLQRISSIFPTAGRYGCTPQSSVSAKCKNIYTSATTRTGRYRLFQEDRSWGLLREMQGPCVPIQARWFHTLAFPQIQNGIAVAVGFLVPSPQTCRRRKFGAVRGASWSRLPLETSSRTVARSTLGSEVRALSRPPSRHQPANASPCAGGAV